MQLRPILSTLGKHKIASLLIILEIAASCAIVCNALFLVGERIARVQRPSGIDETHLVAVKTNAVNRDDDAVAVTRADLDALRALPGVRSAAIVGMVPFGSSSWSSGIKLAPDQDGSSANAPNYMVGEDGVRTLGLQLVAGRDFAADEYVDTAGVSDDALVFPSVILSQPLAHRLFPDGQAVGRSIYVFGSTPHRVVGVVERLVRPRDDDRPATYGDAMLFPGRPSYVEGTYLLNVADPARREAVLEAAKQALAAHGPLRILSQRQSITLEALRQRYYRADRAMAWLLSGVSGLLLLVTALGIVGLASFWVAQRTKQIGIRRALGATRGDILRYFQTENFLLAGIGIVLGMVLAYSLNLLLMSRYELPRLPWFYLPLGAALLWGLGQLAVLGPARRAAAVPPAVATRTT
ncbi:ABC transporter permease [Xanthomonas massiliensis]|uniref:ABC transporter permease n=1 Tax=Xanthomonas massiliensis TaxID=1720302 RepID=UPI000824E0D9|nr:FtsX-like permease family protein [Xanthomonas massiliensis]